MLAADLRHRHAGLLLAHRLRVAGIDSIVIDSRTREQIEQHLYKWGSEVSSNAVEVHIHNLRRKLGAALIETIRGVGYVARK